MKFEVLSDMIRAAITQIPLRISSNYRSKESIEHVQIHPIIGYYN